MRRELLAVLLIAAVAVWAMPASAQWYARGGHYNGWAADAGNELNDAGVNGDAVAADGIFSGLVTSTEMAGTYEFKIAVSDWSVSHPGSNVRLTTTQNNEVVFFSLDTNAHGDGWYPDQNIVWSNRLSPGTIWRLVGGAPELGNWGPASGPQAIFIDSFFDVFVEFSFAGNYEYKWTADNAWDVQQLGFDGHGTNTWNVPLAVSANGSIVQFQFDPATGRGRHIDHGPPSPVKEGSWGAVKKLYR